MSSAVNNLFMFFNVNAQGIAGMMQAAVQSKRAKTIAAMMVAQGFIMDLVNRAL